MKISNHNSQFIQELRQENTGDTFQNPYILAARDLEGILYTLSELHASFPHIFNLTSRPIILDIGCYLGGTVIELARENPGINVLGIDLKFKRVVKSCRKIQRAGLLNSKIVIGDAADVLTLLPENAISGVLIFVPDPWTKRKQRKNRLLDSVFLELLWTKLEAGGFLWLKSDNREYYSTVSAAALSTGFSMSSSFPGEIVPGPYRTIFEKLFISQGKPIYQAFFYKGDKV